MLVDNGARPIKSHVRFFFVKISVKGILRPLVVHPGSRLVVWGMAIIEGGQEVYLFGGIFLLKQFLFESTGPEFRKIALLASPNVTPDPPTQAVCEGKKCDGFLHSTFDGVLNHISVKTSLAGQKFVESRTRPRLGKASNNI